MTFLVHSNIETEYESWKGFKLEVQALDTLFEFWVYPCHDCMYFRSMLLGYYFIHEPSYKLIEIGLYIMIIISANSTVFYC